ncbi:uncharacterized protein EDB93DRAFT_612909 [Suillus bovinus]|uniref:uncharacterized protein n=1 Tax=Suillus bovinus TaxID=48563 RepID=UPI001B8606BF|nr:uncharacterized protein EDB93DRAFT_612909 [Suillus bovinus]KAG2142299.1 hypothetical protein EDB93DRAFT_612909 [Suillus bovinus]
MKYDIIHEISDQRLFPSSERALSMLEALYLSRSTNHLNAAVSKAFTGGSRTPPAANEGVAIARAGMNHLDSTRFVNACCGGE